MSIPKIIHYCWFGGKPKPELAQKCIKSWKKFCPDYEIIEWNETNFDISTAPLYVRQAHEAGRWAFVTDYVRLKAMTELGGIYMDTDVMVRKPLDTYLHHQAFSGFESKTNVPTGIMAAQKGQPLIGEMLSHYDTARFLNADGTFDMTTNVEVITALLLKKGLVPNGEYQEVEEMAFYPQNVFCPDTSRLDDPEYIKDTATIHYFAGSWKSDTRKRRERSLWYKAMVYCYIGLLKVFGKQVDGLKRWISKTFFKD